MPPKSRYLAFAYRRKTHRNLMHLKRKIYFSILAVVNFKINMEMGWVFCTNTIPRSAMIFSISAFRFSLRFECSMIVELLWDDFNVTIDVVCLTSNWRDSFFLVLFILFLALSLTVPLLVGIVFSKKTDSHFLLNRRAAAAVIFSPVELCHSLFTAARQTWMK